MSEFINAIDLIGIKQIHESYILCRETYRSIFDEQMAAMSLRIISLQEESTKEGGINFNEAALLLLITPCEDFSEDDNKCLNHTIRACILWYNLEKPDMVKEIEKVLGNVK